MDGVTTATLHYACDNDLHAFVQVLEKAGMP